MARRKSSDDNGPRQLSLFDDLPDAPPPPVKIEAPQRIVEAPPPSLAPDNADQPKTKRELAESEYKALVESLTEDQRGQLKAFIVDNPSVPGLQTLKMKRELARLAKQNAEAIASTSVGPRIPTEIKRLDGYALRITSETERPELYAELSGLKLRAEEAGAVFPLGTLRAIDAQMQTLLNGAGNLMTFKAVIEEAKAELKKITNVSAPPKAKEHSQDQHVFKIGDLVKPRPGSGLSDKNGGKVQHINTRIDGSVWIKTENTGNMHFSADDWEHVSNLDTVATGFRAPAKRNMRERVLDFLQGLARSNPRLARTADEISRETAVEVGIVRDIVETWYRNSGNIRKIGEGVKAHYAWIDNAETVLTTAPKGADNSTPVSIETNSHQDKEEKSNGSVLGDNQDPPGREPTSEIPPDAEGRRASGIPEAEIGGSLPAEAVLGGIRDAGRHGRRDGDSKPVQLEDYAITAEDRLGSGGPKQKYRDNVAAIRLLSELKERPATLQDQTILVRYVGWGGLPQAFPRPDGTVAKGWEVEAAELKGLLSEDDYASARSSTQDAHYTSETTIRGIYSVLKQFGVRSGRFLEPALGIGNFVGLVDKGMRSRSKFTGVEIDPTSAAIAKHLYPSQNISCSGFHEFTIAPGSFDVAIGNPPFGSKSLFDAAYPDLRNFSIHNYFFAKSLKALRANGILAMVVSSSMMDKRGEAQREWISQHAELLGAIRLPSSAFKENALTEVTTDIIFLRKRGESEKPEPALEHKWQELVEVTGKDGVRYRINEYYATHPEMMLGEIGPNKLLQAEVEDGFYDAAPGLHGSFDDEILRTAIEKLPRNIYRAGQTIEQVQQSDIVVSDVGFAQPYGYTLDDGGQAVRRLPDVNGEKIFEPVLYADKPLEGLRLDRFKGVLKIRDSLRLLVRAEIDDSPNMELLRDRLNFAYDAFVQKFGYISSSANSEIFSDDPTDFPLLRALETNYNKGISKAEASRTGEAPKAPSADKAAIFRVRTREPYRSATKADNAKDALAIVLREDGIPDIDRIAALIGKDEDSIAQELAGLLFQNPKSRTWETAEIYLSGNVKKKLAEAQEAAKQDWRFLDNVRSLEKVQPEDVPAEKIFFQIGATWIPTRIYEQFARDILQSATTVKYNPNVNIWSVVGDSRITTPFQTDRMTAVDIFKDLLRNKDIVVYDRDADGRPFVQMEWTTQARAKADDMQRAFKAWALEVPERRDVLAREFNEKVNTTIEMRPDGSHMIFPGMGIIKPGVKRDDQLGTHQKNAAWRLIQKGEGLLDHVVGAGKTFIAIAAGMEMKRMGLLKKPIYAVPNHLVQQWAIEFQRLYPGANVLVIGKKDFAKARRQEFLGRIATGSWDAVLMAHSSFGFIKMPHDYELRFYKEQIEQYKEAIESMRVADGKKSRSVKQMEAACDRLEEKLKELANKPKDAVVDFSELGVDALFVDEAHEFKNLFYATSRTRVAGLGNPIGSKKAFDMFVKTQFVRAQNNGRGVFFMTGTPVSNSIAEMYTMMRYLRYDRLQEMGIKHFDQWANMFAKTVSDWEVDPSGTRYRLQSKMEFANLPGLMALYKDFADVISTADLKEMARARGQVWPIPDVKGNKPTNVVAERSEIQKNFMEWVVYRFDHMPSDPRKDNPLKATGHAMKGALDIRLIKPELPDYEGSKVNLAVRNIIDIHRKWAEKSGTQLIFCDLSVPKGAASKVRAEIMSLRESIKKAEEELSKDDASDPDRHIQVEQEYIDLTEQLNKFSPAEIMAVDSKFSVYDDIKAKLMSAGVQSSEIAFIHDANTDLQKEQLFEKVRSGRVRVLIGSTSKMGAGMNVQDRLVALHHLDAPWRPADLEQREGRIVRQGNLFYAEALKKGEKFEVEIYRYATNQTLDTRRWQVIERKAVSIGALRSKTHEWGTTLEDALGEATNAAEMKAASSGNPLILEEIKLRQKIKKVEALQSGSRSQRYSMQNKIKEAEAFESTFEQTLKDYWDNKAFIESHPKSRSPDGWEIVLNDQVYKAAGLVAVPPVAEDGDKETLKMNKASIKAAEENNDKALKLAKARYANALRDAEKIESIGYRGVYFDMRKNHCGYVLRADLKSVKRYDSALQEILIDARGSEAISPDGLLVRLDNYLDRVASSAETLTSRRSERRVVLQRSAENAKKELSKTDDFEPQLQRLRTEHASVLKALEDERKNAPLTKPDMSMWVGGGETVEASLPAQPGAGPSDNSSVYCFNNEGKMETAPGAERVHAVDWLHTFAYQKSPYNWIVAEAKTGAKIASAAKKASAIEEARNRIASVGRTGMQDLLSRFAAEYGETPYASLHATPPEISRGGEMDSGVPSMAALLSRPASKPLCLPSFDPRDNVHPQTFGGKIFRVDGDCVYQEVGEKLAKHSRDLFAVAPRVGACYKVVYRRGAGRVEGLISEEEAAKMSHKQGRRL